MMILGTLRHCAFGALLAGLGAPALAGTATEPATAKSSPSAQARGQSADASPSRRVDLPFLLDFRSPDSAPRPPVRSDGDGPHPFRETLLKRAAFAGPVSDTEASRHLRLSPLPEIS
jgi:hypothetical protein